MVTQPPDDSSPFFPARRSHRTWAERLAIGGCVFATIACFAGAGALAIGNVINSRRDVIDITNPAEAAASGPVVIEIDPPNDGTVTTDAPEPTDPTDETSTASVKSTAPAPSTDPPPPTFPDADPEARNFLITGADNGACIDPDTPIDDREGFGERSDTIMILRVDPAASRVALVSFPRDLYVPLAGTGSMGRINTAHERNNPQRLIDTIYANFGIGVNHFIQVDFCAFKTLVDAVGGVAVPFDYPARDPNTGLYVPSTGCFEFTGEQALAYVRSRYYEYEDPVGVGDPESGNWQQDQTFDLGRISRQQDFLRRTLSRVLSKGPLNPRVARGLITSATEYVVTDSGLSPAKLMEFAGVLNRVDPAALLTYQIEVVPAEIGGADVLLPQVDGESMQLVLALFRGEISLAAAPVQVLDPTTTPAPRPNTAGGTTTTSTSATTTSPPTTAGPVVTAPAAPEPQENTFGIVPPRNVSC